MRGGNGRVAIRQPVGLRLASLDGQTLSLCHGAADTPALPSSCLPLSLSLALSRHRLSRRHVAPLCADCDSDNFISKRKASLWAPLKMINARRLAAKKAAIRQRARSANLFVPAPVPPPPLTLTLSSCCDTHTSLALRGGRARESAFFRANF